MTPARRAATFADRARGTIAVGMKKAAAIVIKPYVDWKRFLTPFLPPDGQFGLANRRPGEVVYFP